MFDFACPDWEQRLADGRAPLTDVPCDRELADAAVGIFDSLRIPDIPDQPTFGEKGGDWFRDILRPVFGAIDKETGARLVNELFLLVPKKNSKTTNSAALGIIWLCLNTTRNVKGVIAAPTQEVSETCFEQASHMISLDTDLEKLLNVQEHLKKITNRVTGAVLKIQTFDLKVTTGGIPAFVILDELHVMSGNPRATKILRQIRGGMLTNNQALLVIITTQSMDPPAGVFKAELESARRVRDGKQTGGRRLLPVLYEFPERLQMDERKPFMDPELWHLVTPNLGRSIQLEDLVADFEGEKSKGHENEAIWLSQHLNIQVGMGTHSDRWIGADYWLTATKSELDLAKIMDLSDVVVVGIDGGGMDDLLGLAAIGRHAESRDWMHWGKAWADYEVHGKRPQIGELLEDFERQGDLVFCENGVDDIAEIAELCATLNDAGLLPDENAIGLDPEGVAAIVDALIEAGITDEQLAGITQGYKLNSAIKGTPRKLKNKTLLHCGQPMMAWCVGNAKTESRGNAQIVTKAVSGAGKIDPLMGLFDAVMLMSANPQPSSRARLDDFLSKPVMVI